MKVKEILEILNELGVEETLENLIQLLYDGLAIKADEETDIDAKIVKNLGKDMVKKLKDQE